MPTYRVQAALQHSSGLIEDASTNTWHFTADGPSDLTSVLGALGQFYDDIGTHLSENLSGVIEYRCYDLADPEPRVPVLIDTGTIAALGTDSLPQQVALVLSFQAIAESGETQARRRNRVFTGPYAITAVTAAGIPSATVITNLHDAAETLLATSLSETEWHWVVRSQTTGNIEAVDNGWVDNRWDTQRRRLPRSTARSLFS